MRRLYRVRRRDRADTEWKACAYFAREADARRRAQRWTSAGYVVEVDLALAWWRPANVSTTDRERTPR